MTRPGLLRSLRALACACLGALALACAAQQSPAVGAPAAPPPAAETRIALAAGDILVHADQDQRFIDRLQRQFARPDRASHLLQDLAAIEGPVDEKLSAFGADMLRDLSVTRLESLERHWKFDERRFHQWQLEARLQQTPLDNAAAQLAQRRAVWEATRASAVLQQWPEVLLNRVDAMLAALGAAEQVLAQPLARQIEIGGRANALAARIETGRGEVADAISAIDLGLLQIDSPPVWALHAAGSDDAAATAAFERGLQIEGRFARDYAAAAPVNQRALLLLQPVMLVLLLLLSYRHRAGRVAHVDATSARVLERPVSTWLLLAMMGVLVLEPDAPLLAHQVALLIALVPLLRLLPAHRLPVLDVWPYIAVGLYVVDKLGLLPLATGVWYRAFHFALTLVALLLTLWLLRRSRRHGPNATRAVQVARAAASATAFLLAAALVLNLVGNVSLADTLASGVIDSGYFGLLLYATFGIARALLSALLGGSGVQRLPLLQRHAAGLAATVSRALAFCVGIGWLAYAMDAFRVMRPLQAGAALVLGHRFEVGELSISLGDVLVFGVSVLIAWWVARLVRQLLGEQLSARPSLPRGVANSVASLTYYALLLLGFLMALSAAGFKVSQLALVFGALGVGIGFGLQNIVNNFVSGLVLMFERPLRPGDVVEVAGASGRVREIGMRATVVRTFDGADVVVPNGSLLANSLTNWTLRDHARRIEIEVGVSYDAAPARVLALLEATARETPGVSTDPSPSALMKGFGDSSLDFVLRAWTTDYERWTEIRSALLARTLAALGEAGIAIPFNQVDLNLRTVSGPAGAALRDGPAAPTGDAAR